MNYVYDRNPDYETWIGMKRFKGECCTAWMKSFDRFISDMGERPNPKMVLARLDPAKPFSKNNCKWMTRKEQCGHRRPKGHSKKE
jgi:hypothetical protein